MSGTPLPADASFADLWPVRELGTWLVALEQRRIETIHEAPFVKALGLWLRVLRDQGGLVPVSGAYGRRSWQIQGWNTFVCGGDDVVVRQTLAELGHALHQGVVATEWSMDPTIDPSDAKAVSALHARIVAAIDAGDTDPIVSPWNVRDMRVGADVSIAFSSWRPRVADVFWDQSTETTRPTVPVMDLTRPINMPSGAIVVMDPADVPGLEDAIAIEGDDFDPTVAAGAVALSMETSERHGLGLLILDHAVDVLISDDRDVLLLVRTGHRRPGFLHLGRVEPMRGRIVIGDAGSIADLLRAHVVRVRGVGARSGVEADDLANAFPSSKVEQGLWMLEGDDMPPFSDDSIVAVARQFQPKPRRRLLGLRLPRIL
jgi:hypothetical protein